MHAKFMLGLDAFPCILGASDPPPAASPPTRERTVVTRWGYYAPARRERLLQASVGNARACAPAGTPSSRGQPALVDCTT